MKLLAIIPARKGSKRILNKNKKIIAGKPLIRWTIDAAKKVDEISEIIVTTDDEDIINIAKKCNVTYVKRDDSLATDNASSIDVIFDVLNKVNNRFDYLILLQPTSPLRNSYDIKKAIGLIKEKKADAIISVTETDHPVQWMNILPLSCSMNNFISDKYINTRSQDLEKYYRINGAIYICKIDNFIKEKSLFLKRNIYAFKMERLNSIDIDEEIDFEFAELALNKQL